VLTVMFSPFPPPHTQTSYPWPQHTPCPLSQDTTIGGGIPPSIMGSRRRLLHCRAAWPTLVDFVLTVTLSTYRRDLTPILSPTQHPCMQPPSATHSHPPHGLSANLINCAPEIFLSVFYGHPFGSLHHASVNSQPWRFTNNILGLPPAYSLSVCLFL